MLPVRICLLLMLLLPCTVQAQRSLDLGVGGVGLSIGNSRRWTGIRMNWRDHLVERVNGINLSIRDADSVPAFAMNGLALGVVATEAAHFRGVALGLGGVVAHEKATGISIATLPMPKHHHQTSGSDRSSSSGVHHHGIISTICVLCVSFEPSV